MPALTSARTSLFEGLDGAALEDILGQMRPRRFAAREVICRQGDARRQSVRHPGWHGQGHRGPARRRALGGPHRGAARSSASCR